jgi:hypothetical protein
MNQKKDLVIGGVMVDMNPLVLCCSNFISSDANFCSGCGKNLTEIKNKKEQTEDDILALLDDILIDNKNQYQIKDETMNQNIIPCKGNEKMRTYINLIFRNYFKNNSIHDPKRVKSASIIICYGENRNLLLTDKLHQLFIKLNGMELYFYEDGRNSNDSTSGNIYTKKEILELMSVENVVFGLDSLFEKEVKYQNITFKYMTSDVLGSINYFRSNCHPHMKHLRDKIRKNIHPLNAMLLMMGFQSPSSV